MIFVFELDGPYQIVELNDYSVAFAVYYLGVVHLIICKDQDVLKGIGVENAGLDKTFWNALTDIDKSSGTRCLRRTMT